MTDKTPEALALAIEQFGGATAYQAAALLRRQHQRIEALRKELVRISRISADGLSGMQDAIDRIEAASGIANSILSTAQQEDSQA